MMSAPELLPLPPGLVALTGDEGAGKTGLLRRLCEHLVGLDQRANCAALDASSICLVREFLADVADHTTRTWVVADYEADPHLPWRRHVALG